MAFSNQQLINTHYQHEHDVHFIHERLKFETRDKFKDWLVNLQRNLASQFFTYQKWQNSNAYILKLRCHRSGLQSIKEKRNVRFEKIGGSKKLRGYCPAEIIVEVSKKNKTVCVTYQKTHVGHLITSVEELKFVSIDAKEKDEIVKKLESGVPQDRILLKYNLSVQPDESQYNRTDLIDYDDVANIAKKAGLNTVYRAPFKDDARNVLSFIFDHPESILFFKAKQKEDTEFGQLLVNDFALVYMDPFQKRVYNSSVIRLLRTMVPTVPILISSYYMSF